MKPLKKISRAWRAALSGALFLLLLGTSAALLALPLVAPPVFNIENGTQRLLGVSGLSVGGSLFDVQFSNGAGCQDGGAGGGCIPSEFHFTDVNEAHSASLALSDLVFVNNGIFQFDTAITLIPGCNIALLHCQVWTPYFRDGDDVYGSVINNSIIESLDSLYTAKWSSNTFSLSQSHITWATWAPAQMMDYQPLQFEQISEVPEPASIALIVFGLAAIGFLRKRDTPGSSSNSE